MRDLSQLPADLPVPTDDGAARHLHCRILPDLALESTRGRMVNLSDATAGRAVLFFYPRSGRPEQPPPDGWDLIPGARGCTPQSCGFRDLAAEFSAFHCAIFGVSTQTSEYQREFANRVHLPFELLSDAQLALTHTLQLPTMDFPIASGGPRTLIKRLSILVEARRIVQVWYPVFPPNENAATVLAWLRGRPTGTPANHNTGSG